MEDALSGRESQLDKVVENESREFEQLMFLEKIQFIVDNCVHEDLRILLLHLSHLEGALDIYPRARAYILNKLVSRIGESDRNTVAEIEHLLRAWCSSLGSLSVLEQCYAKEMLNIADDIIRPPIDKDFQM